MIMHGLFIIVVGILTLLLSIITDGLSIDMTGITSAIASLSQYINKAIRIVQYLYTQNTYNGIITFIGAYITISITITLITAVIKIWRGNIQ